MPTKKEIENLIDLAKEKFTSGSFEASIKIFDEIIELNPDKESILLAYFYRATVNSELGENDNAIIDFSKMIEINPEDGQDIGVVEGDRVNLITDNGDIEGVVSLSGPHKGLVSITSIFGELMSDLSQNKEPGAMSNIGRLNISSANIVKIK